MSSSKKFPFKGTLRQVFLRVYRLEIQSVILVFSTQFCELLSFQPSLWFSSPPPPFPVWISILNTRIQCVGGYGVPGLRQINTCRKVPLQVNFFRWRRHFALPSMSFNFLGNGPLDFFVSFVLINLLPEGGGLTWFIFFYNTVLYIYKKKLKQNSGVELSAKGFNTTFCDNYF